MKDKILTKRIVLINCYFGKLPDYFRLFLQSCEYNRHIDFLFVTDQKVNSSPENVRFIPFDFLTFKSYIEKQFDFPIVLDNPYKLCDYKPAYGYLLKEYIGDYDFWGHVDIDLVLGKIDVFINDYILEKYDKIYQLGHLCLYKNNDENNKRFMSDIGMNYRDVFSTKTICVFDEMIGMQDKYNKMSIPTYKNRDMIDISPKYYKFNRVDSWISADERKNNNYRYQTFYWEKGHVYRAALIEGRPVIDEFIYIHFPKRHMPGCKSLAAGSPFFITNYGFCKKDGVLTKEEIINKTNNSGLKNLVWMFRDKKRKFIRKVNKYVLHR